MLYLHDAMENTLKSTMVALLWHDAGSPSVSLTYSWATTTGLGYRTIREDLVKLSETEFDTIGD